ncbi:GPC1 Glycerophosphocholine acyltransferase 1 [Candida maltosa Xu316]
MKRAASFTTTVSPDDGSALIDDDDAGPYSFASNNASTSSFSSPQLTRSDSTVSVPFLDLSKLMFANDFDFGLNLNDVSDNTRKRLSSMKMKTRQKLHGKNIDLDKLQAVINQSLQKFDQRVHKNLVSSSTEKAFYAFSVFLIFCAGLIIGKYPIYFPHFHTALFVLLMPIRFYTYFKQSFQYYLADLCYYVNLLLMLFIWVFPGSPTLFVSVFSLSLGTLSWAVITWRNSLVLHSIEKTTSSFIHFVPPVTMFVMVHELPADYIKQRYPGIAAIDSWNFAASILTTSIYYTIWQVKKDQIDKGRVTSFQYLKTKNKSTPLGKFVNGLPYLWMQTLAFTLIQFGYQLLTMIPCPIWFKYKHACGVFVSFIFIWASYNGATYYIDVFGKRLEKEVDRLKREVENLQQEKEKLQFSPVQQPQNSTVEDFKQLDDENTDIDLKENVPNGKQEKLSTP